MSCQVWFGTTEDRASFRIEGRATQEFGQPIRELSLGLINNGSRRFEFDLSGCASMDSTIIGVLVQIALRLKEIGKGSVVLFDVNPHLQDALDTLGISPFLNFAPAATLKSEVPQNLQRLSCAKPGEREWARTILSAHQTLVEADNRNFSRFQDVLQLLDQELRH